ncbi:MAG: CarD family transcriptional regulator [Alphaproteobacteria bacterium]|nr:CarD family transcriptional regulator [Alphaproteobacteria bacterium]MBP1532395.1 CarD family transcriptional regulator [Alphaproteobacteria bacterium]
MSTKKLNTETTTEIHNQPVKVCKSTKKTKSVANSEAKIQNTVVHTEIPTISAEKINIQKSAVSDIKKLPTLSFNTGEYVVYPTQGVGKVSDITKQTIAGSELELLVVNFDKDKMTLRIPTNKISNVGLRKISDEKTMQEAFETLKGKAKVRKTMWSRRQIEYSNKINSGNPVAIAEVIRDLYRSENLADQSYSERQIYEQAVERLASEVSIYSNCSMDEANNKLTDILAKNKTSV